jgi:CDP-6-deoxy-D-xylo-4-hexulose-3-dehydrase
MLTSTLVKHPLAVQTWDAAEVDAAIAVLQSGRTTMGDTVQGFEAEFARTIGTKYAVMVNSGSSANLLMVAAYTLRYGRGSVIVPAIAWSTSYAPFQQYGWRLIFVDVDSSLCIDPREAKRAKSQYRANLLLAVNLLGNPCDFGSLPPVPWLEDNCEGLGATYWSGPTGSWGEMGTHSLFFSHHLHTMEGGVITTNDRTFYDLLLSLRSHGWTRHLSADNTLGATVAPFEFILPGYNVRPLELQAAIGLKQLEKLPDLIRVRRENAAACPLPLPREVGQSSWMGFATPRTPELDARCETRPVVAGNFVRSPAIKHFDHVVCGDLPMANKVHDAWCYLGNHGTPIDWAAVLG